MIDMHVSAEEEAVLRDLFASRAISGILAKVASPSMPQGSREAVAKLAYQIADAMMAERAKCQPTS